MRKIVSIIVFGFIAMAINAQNVQLHYDFGKDRQMPTTTVEMFKPDKLGNTFFFIDFDYGAEASGVKGINLGYWEIARVLKTEAMPVGFHVEYDGGFGRYATSDTTPDAAYRINDCFLAGADYSINASDYSKGVTFKALYKYIADKNNATFQFTTVWYWHLLDKKLTFSGFADFWLEESDFDYDGTADASFVFLTEPQLWYNFNDHFSAGTEIEISSNFAGNEGFMVNPTVAVKYNF